MRPPEDPPDRVERRTINKILSLEPKYDGIYGFRPVFNRLMCFQTFFKPFIIYGGGVGGGSDVLYMDVGWEVRKTNPHCKARASVIQQQDIVTMALCIRRSRANMFPIYYMRLRASG